MSKQPVAVGEGSSSVAKGVHLFSLSNSEPTIYGVPLHLPMITLLLMEAAYPGNKKAERGPAVISPHHIFPLLLDIMYAILQALSRKLAKNNNSDSSGGFRQMHSSKLSRSLLTRSLSQGPWGCWSSLNMLHLLLNSWIVAASMSLYYLVCF